MRTQNSGCVKKLGPFEIDADSCTIKRDGARNKVTPRSMDVLLHLATHSNRIVSSNELLDMFWSPVASDHAVHKAIAELRNAMGDNGRYQRFIKTVPKRGYKLLALPDIEGNVDQAGSLTGVFNTLHQELKFIDYKSVAVGICAVIVISILLLLASALQPRVEARRSFIVALHPFESLVTDLPNIELFSRSLYSNLVTSLASQQQLSIIAVDNDAGSPHSADERSANTAGPSDYQIRGVIIQNDRELRLFINLVRTSSGIVEYSERLTLESAMLDDLPDTLTARVVASISRHLEATRRDNPGSARVRP